MRRRGIKENQIKINMHEDNGKENEKEESQGRLADSVMKRVDLPASSSLKRKEIGQKTERSRVMKRG